MDISPVNPKPKYHPYVVEAIKLMYAKAPDELTPEEWNQFTEYYKWRKAKGEPVEEDIVYKPRSSWGFPSLVFKGFSLNYCNILTFRIEKS